MNQEQKDTIREEFYEKFIKHRVLHGGDRYPRLESIETSNEIVDFILNKLDQAYQQGAKDKVEEVMNNVENSIDDYFINNTIPDAKIIMGYVRQSLKDNT